MSPITRVWVTVLLLVILFAIAVRCSPAANPKEEVDYGRLCIALTVFTEQNRLQPEGMDMVALVILNRLRDDKARYGDTICDVTRQTGQFVGIEALGYPRDPVRTDATRWAMSLRAARRAIAGEAELPGPCVSDKPILYFHSGDRPYWAHSLHFVCKIDGEYFYSEN